MFISRRHSAVHGSGNHRQGPSRLRGPGRHLVPGVHHHRDGHWETALPRVGRTTGGHVQGKSASHSTRTKTSERDVFMVLILSGETAALGGNVQDPPGDPRVAVPGGQVVHLALLRAGPQQESHHLGPPQRHVCPTEQQRQEEQDRLQAIRSGHSNIYTNTGGHVRSANGLFLQRKQTHKL